ncbi:MAG TPA: hypothetical protein DCZ88_01005 [Pseudanabaena sp.]|nr:hypothetical protein [Pseudanabaena sp.]
MTLSLDQITHLLNGLKSLPPLRKQEQTFMEIAGYPHFENVCSNILQFYLQPSNEHGFGSLLLDSLFTLINEKVVINGQNIDVRREESTSEGKRIDLIIESDDFLLGIENKIFADAYNRFDKYAEHLNKYLRKDRQVYKVLLSVFPIDTSKAKLHGFKPITYQLLFEQVIANIGSYFLTGREPHTIFLRDFIQTIQNLQEATSMDESRLLYFADNHESISTLFAEVIEMQKDMRKKVKQLNEVVLSDAVFSDIDQSPYPIKSGFWLPSAYLVAVSWYTIVISNSLSLQFDVVLTPKGWFFRFFDLRNKKNPKQVENWVNDRRIKVELNSEKNSPINFLIYKGENDSLPYSTSSEDSGRWALDMLKRLTDSLD